MREIKTTPFYSKKLGKLAKGCQMCIKGEKLVLYITGLCPRKCWFCPLSEKRKNKDIIFLNEWETDSLDDLIKEVKLCQSKGAGITGGDPLIKLDRTLKYIKILKQNFSKNFHIHLYTSFDLVTQDNLKKLYNQGLDEIRFHPDLDDKSLWEKIEFAQKYKWDIGIEIPCIPNKEKEIKEICDYFNRKINFLNLNEFETSEYSFENMDKQKFITKSDISYAIKGSQNLANKILRYCKNKAFNVHYCSAKLKDKVQMTNRLKLRAQNVKTKYDIITKEGTLYRGIIYLKNFNSYELKTKIYDKTQILNQLKEKKDFLTKEGLDITIDKKKLRLITYPEHIEQFSEILKSLDLIPTLIEEDPSSEQFELNIDYL
ncbi:MAG: radical SAM protein [Nanoarchaeota archaeon]